MRHETFMKLMVTMQTSESVRIDNRSLWRTRASYCLGTTSEELSSSAAKKKKTRECKPVHDVSPLIIKVSIETYKNIHVCAGTVKRKRRFSEI